MARRVGVRARLRYWFDNTMSRGTISLIGWLAVASVALIVVVTGRAGLVEPPPTGRRAGRRRSACCGRPSSPRSAWPCRTAAAVARARAVVRARRSAASSSSAPWSVCSPAASTSGWSSCARAARWSSRRDHTVILGWSDQVFTVVSELVEANRSRRRATVAILAEQDKVDDGGPAAPPARRPPATPGSSAAPAARSTSPTWRWSTSTRPGRSSCWRRRARRAEDADAYVLKTLLAINRGPAFRGRPHHVVAAVRDGRNRAVARLAGGDAVVIDGDDISARLVVQTARQSRLSVVYHDLLDFGGDEFYLVAEPRLVGQTFGAGAAGLPQVLPGRHLPRQRHHQAEPADGHGDRAATTSSSCWPRTTRRSSWPTASVHGRPDRRWCTRSAARRRRSAR